MTLLDDLQALDLSVIIDGKVHVAAAIDTDAITELLADGAITSILGDLGAAIDVAVAAVEDPSTVVQPIIDVLLELVDQIDLGDVPITEYVEAVAAAARIVIDVVGMISGDPRAISFGDGSEIASAGGALDAVGNLFGDHATVVSGELARFRALVQTVERGLPDDPVALLGTALEILVPFPTEAIEGVTLWADGLVGQLDELVIDPALTSGLISAYGSVKMAADAGDLAAVNQALADLERVRTATIGQLATALRTVASAISALRIGDAAALVADLRAVLAGADDTVLDVLEDWRQMIASVRETIGEFDPAVAMAAVDDILTEVEQTARDVLVAGVEGSVEVVKQWLRDLLREIPIRPLRQQLGQAIAAAATAIADADLDAPVDAVRGALADAAELLADADPAALVQAAVAQVEAAVTQMIDQVAAALGSITSGIEAVADQAEDILQRALGGITEFRAVVHDVTAAIEQAGIIDAANQIVATLQDLREDVSQLLSAAPLPDALRTGIEQLISTLESIDLDAAIGDPLREVAAQIQIPEEVATTVREGLEALADTVIAVVPTDVIAELDGLLADAIGQLEALDVSGLTEGVTDALDQAAAVLERVRFTDLLQPAGDAFATVLDVVDQVHPRIVLAPAINIYREVMDAVPVPDPETITTRAADVTAQAGEAAARAAAEPARRAVSTEATMPPAGAPSDVPREEPPADLRPGDIVRLIGLLPAKLREALAGLTAGELGDVLAALDRTFAGSAQLLLGVRDRIVGMQAAVDGTLSTALQPIAAAQVDAQFALQGSAVLSADGFDAEASFSLLASAGPGPLQVQLEGERQLVAERCATAVGALSGALANDLDQAAQLLTSVLPGEVLADADALLAALDPEPIAAELDGLLAGVLDATPAFLTAAEAEIRALEARIRALIDTFNPGALMQRFLAVLEVIGEELALLDPGRLADELGEVHAQTKAAIAAYDPTVLAGELDGLVDEVAAAIRGLDPAGLLPDLSGIGAQVDRLGEIVPVQALAGVGTQLEAVGDELRQLDLQAMLDAVNALTPKTAEAIESLVEAVRDEIVTLLESLRYSATNASASGSISVGVGG